jgi:hypothetical protein
VNPVQVALWMIPLFGGIITVIGLLTFFKGHTGETEGAWNAFTVKLPSPLFLIVVGVCMIAFPVWLMKDDLQTKSSQPVPSPSRSSSSSMTTVNKEPAFSISKPEEREEVSGRKGVMLSGTASDLKGDSLWVMVIAKGAGDEDYYYLASDALTVREGDWGTLVRPIGAGASDVGELFTIVVVQAENQCSSRIKATKRNSDGVIVFAQLPPGCIEMGRRTVQKTSS